MKYQISKIILHFALSFCILIFSFYIFNGEASAASASLYLAPSSGAYAVGNTFSVEVKVNSGGQAINAADATLVFDVNDLEVKSISKENSIFSLWVQEPVFSNSLGTISFGGGKPSPGFTGAGGIIITITFKVKTAGSVDLTFASGSVLADDGKGTNILSNMGSAFYKLESRSTTSFPPAESQPPTAPVVASPTHPDENKWYSNNGPEFQWQLPQDITKISYVIDQNPLTNPKFVSEDLIKEIKFTDLEDGISYFHINFRNQYGWGELTHRKVMIDTKIPEPFKIIIDNKNDATNPRPTLYFESNDFVSGIEYYEIIITGESYSTTTLISLTDIKDNPYFAPLLLPGKYKVTVKAFDKAGNSSSATTEIEIIPIESPVITKYQKNLTPGQSLSVEGTGPTSLKILLFLQAKDGELLAGETKTDETGKWRYVSPALEKGEYLLWAKTEDERGAQSLPTEKLKASVGLPLFLRFGAVAIGYFSIISTLLALILIIVLVAFYVSYKISVWRKKMRIETKELSRSVLAAFKALKKEVEEQIEELDGKPGLNKAEKEVRDNLKEALKISEKFIGKELKDVEKELK